MTGPTPDGARLGFYLTPDHPCAYLADRTARTVFADPEAQPDLRMQTALAAAGFRRSGRFLYRPHCAACQACVPLRLPVDEFVADRGQRRVLRANRAIVVTPAPLARDEEHYALYQRYQQARHPDGAMQTRAPEEFLEYFASSFADTRLHAMREDGALLGVMVVDHLDDALSAVYTFFDPTLQRRSLGTWAVLWQISEARRLGLRWLYLGYQIDECRKMAYKSRFRPHETLAGGVWHRAP